MDGALGTESAKSPAAVLRRRVSGVRSRLQEQRSGYGEQDRRLVQLWHNGTLGKKRRQ